MRNEYLPNVATVLGLPNRIDQIGERVILSPVLNAESALQAAVPGVLVSSHLLSCSFQLGAENAFISGKRGKCLLLTTELSKKPIEPILSRFLLVKS